MMPHSKSTVKVAVLIAGKQIEWPFRSLELKQSAFEHHILKVTVAMDIEESGDDARFIAIDKFQNALGKSITVKVTPQDEYVASSEELNFVGIISNVSFENDADAINRVTFHAKSPTWKMSQSKINHFWEEQTLKDVVSAIVSKYALEKDSFDVPSPNFPFLVQFGETDWDFLRRVCRRESRWVFYDGVKFNIATAKSKNTHSIDWQKNIGEFDLGIKIGQLDFKSDLYDEKQSSKLVGDSKQASLSTDFSKLTKKAFNVSKSEFTDKSEDEFPKHLDSSTKLKSYMQNRKQAALGQLVGCKVQSNVPAVKVGDTVKVEKMKDFDGTYFVTEIVHSVEDGGKYYNNFDAVPLEIAHPSWKVPNTKIPPMQTGKVVNNQDPESRARVKVQLYYTDEQGQDLVTPFLRVISHHAGNGYGTYFLPDVGDEVLVGFERGNPEMPVVLGNLWNGQVTPDSAVVDNDNNFKSIYTRGGNKIDFGDADGSQLIKITNAAKNSIVLDCSGPSISIKTEGDISIEATKGITVKAGEDLKLEAGKDIEIKAGSNYKLEAGQNVEEKAGMNTTMKAGMKMESSAMQIAVKGSTQVEVKGALIQLN